MVSTYRHTTLAVQYLYRSRVFHWMVVWKLIWIEGKSEAWLFHLYARLPFLGNEFWRERTKGQRPNPIQHWEKLRPESSTEVDFQHEYNYSSLSVSVRFLPQEGVNYGRHSLVTVDFNAPAISTVIQPFKPWHCVIKIIAKNPAPARLKLNVMWGRGPTALELHWHYCAPRLVSIVFCWQQTRVLNHLCGNWIMFVQWPCSNWLKAAGWERCVSVLIPCMHCALVRVRLPLALGCE